MFTLSVDYVITLPQPALVHLNMVAFISVLLLSKIIDQFYLLGEGFKFIQYAIAMLTRSRMINISKQLTGRLLCHT